MVQFFHPRPDPRPDPRCEWHRWFAWRPVRIKPGDGTRGPVVWLETIERQLDVEDGWGQTFVIWWYRLPAKEPQG